MESNMKKKIKAQFLTNPILKNKMKKINLKKNKKNQTEST